MNISMITCQDYCVVDPDALETPAMLLYQDMMDHNIRSACEMVGGGSYSLPTTHGLNIFLLEIDTIRAVSGK